MIVGGLGRAVADLSESLVALGHDVRVITLGGVHGTSKEEYRGVSVVRCSSEHPTPTNFLEAVLYFNFQVVEEAVKCHQENWRWDVVHGHDWLIAHSAKVLKQAYKKPLIATIHATEHGRNKGIHNELQRHIHSVEWWLTYEAYRVLCCSEHMYDEVSRLFQVPEDKLSVLPNGVRLTAFKDTHPDQVSFRARYADPEEILLFFVGRLVHEKGVKVLLEALALGRQRYPLRLVIAGKGPELERLMDLSKQLGMEEFVHFTGFIDDLTRNTLYRVSDIAIFPSLYEPFGIVALEAMANQVPVIVSNVGGFSEIVRTRENGMTFAAGNPHSLVMALAEILDSPSLRTRVKKQALREVREYYDWDAIAKNTAETYLKAYEVKRKFTPGWYQSKLHYERYHSTTSCEEDQPRKP